jgi:hypothetical protein
MRTASTAAVIFVVLMILSGCPTKTKTAPPAQAEAPILPPSKMVHIPELPGLPPPPLRDVVVATAQAENPGPVHPHKVARRKSSAAVQAKATAQQEAPSTAASDKPDPAQTQQATNGAGTDVSPIGQLSSTGESANSQGRYNVERLISDTENGLNGIKRTLSSEEQLTSTQIRTFLAKAKQALAENDLDGAQTLADKAKVLLQELTKQ